MARVAIIGAGVSGLSVGLCLADTHETKDLDLVILSDKFSPCDGLASDAAGGLIRPTGPSSYGGAVMDAATRRWTAATYDRLHQLHCSNTGPECGVTKMPFFHAHRESHPPLPWYAPALHPEFRVLSPAETEERGLPVAQFGSAWEYECYRIETSQYLHYLARRFRESGGTMIQKRVRHLKELTGDYDVVINCTGIGARELVGDRSVFPVRGQLVEVQATGVSAAYFTAEPGKKATTYIIPSNDRVLLGGTADTNDWSTAVKPQDTDSIYSRCMGLCPQLKGSKIVRAWAGLRPVRPTVRVEIDEEIGGESLLIHNYGHGGHGFTFSWGCATDVAQMVSMNLQLAEKCQSKL